MNLAPFRRKALRNQLEVEHILRAAKSREPGLADLFRSLIKECDWTDGREFPDGSIEIPYRRWANVSIAYCEGGCPRVIALAQKDQAYLTFALAMFEEVQSEEAVLTTLRLAGTLLDKPERDLKASVAIAESLNLQLLEKRGVGISANDAARIRAFVHALLQAPDDGTDKSTALYALRSVGDGESLALLAKLPPLDEFWADAIKKVTRAIKKRLQH